jgi:hypothetical protein
MKSAIMLSLSSISIFILPGMEPSVKESQIIWFGVKAHNLQHASQLPYKKGTRP